MKEQVHFSGLGKKIMFLSQFEAKKLCFYLNLKPKFKVIIVLNSIGLYCAWEQLCLASEISWG